MQIHGAFFTVRWFYLAFSTTGGNFVWPPPLPDNSKVIKRNLTTGKVQITRNKHFIEGMHFLKLLNECFFFFKQLYPNSWMNKSWFNAVNIVINWTRKKFASLFYVKVDCKNSTGFIIDLNSLNYRLFFIQIQLTSCNSCKSPEYMTFKIYKNSSWKIFSVYI